MPAPGEPGSETWPKGEQWKNGGGSVWVTGNYDPATNLAYWGVGNGGPWMGDQRPGDNLYHRPPSRSMWPLEKSKATISTIPTNRGIGTKCRRRFWSTYQRNGKTVKGLVDVARDGYLWFLERTDGAINFVDGTPYVKQNVYKSLDPKTGRPEVDPDAQTRYWQDCDFLPVAVGRQELAADRLQSADPHDLHSRRMRISAPP